MRVLHHAMRGGTGGRLPGVMAILFFCSLMTLNAQIFEWTKHGGGKGWKHGNDIALDEWKNVFIVGEFSDVPNTSTPVSPLISFSSSLHLATQGNVDGFITMYDADSNLQWVHQIKAKDKNSSVTATSIAVASGNVLYVTGEISGNIEFLKSSGPYDQYAHPRSSFIAKYTYTNTAAQMEWVAIAGPVQPNEGSLESTGIAIDNNANPYICGNLKGDVEFRCESADTHPASTIDRPNATNLFVAKYSTAGDIIWAQASDASVGAYAEAIAVTSTGDAVVTGRFIKSVTFAPAVTSSGPITLGDPFSASPVHSQFVLARCNAADGKFAWAVQGIGNSVASFATGQDVTIDNNGNAYVVGRFTRGINFYSSPPPFFLPSQLLSTDSSNFFIVKYDQQGTLGWIKKGDVGVTSDAHGNSIAVYEENNDFDVFITGAFSGRMKIGGITLGAMGNHDVFAARYDKNGNVKWAQRAGNVYGGGPFRHPSRNHYHQGMGIAVDDEANCYIVGEYGGLGRADGDARFFRTPLSSNHFRNVFTSKVSSTAAAITGQVTVDGQPHANHIVEIVDPVSLAVVDYVTTGTNGEYTTYIPVGEEFRVQARPYPNRIVEIPGGGSFHTVNARTSGADFDFLSVSDQGDSLQVGIIVQSTEYAVPKGTVRYLITFENLGTTPKTGAVIRLVNDALLEYVSHVSTSSPGLGIVDHISETEHTWNIQDPFLPRARGEISVYFTLKESAEGTSISSEAQLTSTSPQASSKAVVAQDVFYPSDPNKKTPSPLGNIPAADVRAGMNLAYTVGFFNVGAATANKVYVYDTLTPSFFDVASLSDLTLIDASPVKPAHTVPSTNRLMFTFENANLRAMHESVSGSHGFVEFSVPLVPTIPVGTRIRNRAVIVFDKEHSLYTNYAENCVAPDFTFTNACSGSNTQFITSSTNGSYLPQGASNISWAFGDSTTSNDTNPLHLYASPGTYEVVLRFRYESLLCTDTLPADSMYEVRKLVVISAPPPKPTIESIGDSLRSSLPADSYQWRRDNVIIPGATDRIYRPTQSGSYTVWTYNASGCGSESNPKNYVSAVPGEEPSESMEIHPNPGSGRFIIDLGAPAAQKGNISIIDVRGVVVLERRLDIGERSYEIDLKGYPSGSYLARIEIGEKIVVRRFILQR